MIYSQHGKTCSKPSLPVRAKVAQQEDEHSVKAMSFSLPPPARHLCRAAERISAFEELSA